MGDFVLIVVILIVVYFIVVLLQKLLGSVQNKIEPDNKSEIDLYLIDNELEQSKFSQYLNSNQDVTIKYQRKFMLQESFNSIKDLSNWEVAIYKCHVKNGDYVNEGDIIYSLKVQKIGKDWWKTFDVKCLKSGYIEIISDVIGDSSDLISSSNCLKEFDVLYKIYNSNTDDLFANYYSECEPIITVDNFLNTKDIKWKKIAGQSDKISYSDGFEFDNDLADCLNLSSSGHKKSLLYFTLNCIENKDFIIFKTINKYLKLNKGDVIHFLFDDNSKINFEINKCVYNNINCDGDKLFESNIQITSGELEKLANHTLINWKIEFNNGSDKLIDEVDNKSLQFSINYFTKEYIKLVKKEIENHIPLNDSKLKKSDITKNEKCYVYLMIDITNNYHKIGISNHPKYREKTLQSEKPTIEMVANKEFPNRKIAHSFEQALHSTFDEKRVRGEWFDLSQDEVNDIIESLN